MKVQSKPTPLADRKRPSASEIRKKIEQRQQEQQKEATKVEIASKNNETKAQSPSAVKHSDEENFGDIGKNDPKSEQTQEKLRHILRTGAFHFNERERAALEAVLAKK